MSTGPDVFLVLVRIGGLAHTLSPSNFSSAIIGILLFPLTSVLYSKRICSIYIWTAINIPGGYSHHTCRPAIVDVR